MQADAPGSAGTRQQFAVLEVSIAQREWELRNTRPRDVLKPGDIPGRIMSKGCIFGQPYYPDLARARARAREIIKEFTACPPTADQRSYKWSRTRTSMVTGPVEPIRRCRVRLPLSSPP